MTQSSDNQRQRTDTTAATLRLAMGVDARTVMALMGWSSMALLQRYQHVVDELRRDAALRMGQTLWE